MVFRRPASFFLDGNGVLYPSMKMEKDFSLAKLTTFRIGGSADMFCEVATKEDLLSAIRQGQEKGERILILGGGSNILFSDAGYRGIVIRIRNTSLSFEGDFCTAGSGVLISTLVQTAKKEGLDLSSFLALPGTIGGAVSGNAGTPTWDTSQYLEEAEIFDLEAHGFKTVKKEWFEFSYRNSRILRDRRIIIWSIRLQAPRAESSVIQEGCKKMLLMRKEKQPPGLSAGSFFKNLPVSPSLPYPKNTAGWMIDSIGGKGMSVGSAQVSEKHANFLMNNDGKATQKDVIGLAEKVALKVYEKYGVKLEPEVKILDESGDIIPLEI